MFDIGFAELLVIAAVALVVLGPEKLPTAVRTLGLWVGRAKRTIGGIQREISEELRMEELRRTSAIEKEKLDKELNEMRQPFSDASNDIQTATKVPEHTKATPEPPSEQSEKSNG
ncbi:Sec-independent protein translocase protein TatB [Neptunomonas phycophila]|uniref:Sec-independent protein translocase protein TatB n=1 Tax=Neptunomonas phycophila TaxID=1572645 RepID=A0AAW7XGA9_9GAMM|nr:Sec-independent protein translocase protein TatB [Neptunomonas phycophila]MDO6453314.1 Sec-independent protein translocase protein TatB [Neptunomonas phycophila]